MKKFQDKLKEFQIRQAKRKASIKAIRLGIPLTQLAMAETITDPARKAVALKAKRRMKKPHTRKGSIPRVYQIQVRFDKARVDLVLNMAKHFKANCKYQSEVGPFRKLIDQLTYARRKFNP